jgi:hypothetical protein
MDWQTFTVILVLVSMLFIFEQRADPTRRKAVRYFTYFGLFLLLVYTWWYGAWQEGLFALFSAIVISGLFWLLIGRYNPASSSDDIRVLGMDD